MSEQHAQSSFIGAHLAPTVAELMNLREVAAGRADPDLIIRSGKVLALRIAPELDPNHAGALTHDSSTNALIARYCNAPKG